MSEPRLCCNCLHCARWQKKSGIECHCDLDDKYLGYLTVMDEENDCKHWEKETKWDLQKEHDVKVREDAIKEYNISLKKHWIEEDDLSLSDDFFKYVDRIAKQLKEKNSGK